MNFHANYQIARSKNGRVMAVGQKEDILVRFSRKRKGFYQYSYYTEPIQFGETG